MNPDMSEQEAVFTIRRHSCSLIIKKCDIFTQKGLKAIHCPRTFETDLRIIYEKSVIGQFMRKYDSIKDSIASQIKAYTENKQLPNGYEFPPGSVCPIEINNEKFCLCAFNEQTEKNQVKDMSIADYIAYWEQLWPNIKKLKAEEVSIAVPGGRIVDVGPSGFNLEQKIGVIVHTFFKCLQDNKRPCLKLTICLWGMETEDFNYTGWGKSILPYLWDMSYLPIRWQVSNEKTKQPGDKGGGIGGDKDHESEMRFQNLKTDMIQIAKNIEDVIGDKIEQKSSGGSSQTITIAVDHESLRKIADHLGDDSKLRSYLSKGDKEQYDPNHLFEILSILIYEKNMFGPLNKQNIVRVCLGYTKTDHTGSFEQKSDVILTDSWRKLGTRISAISRKFENSYKEIQKHQKYYDLIKNVIDTEYKTESL